MSFLRWVNPACPSVHGLDLVCGAHQGWDPPEEQQAVGETFGVLKRIHLGSREHSQLHHTGNK